MVIVREASDKVAINQLSLSSLFTKTTAILLLVLFKQY